MRKLNPWLAALLVLATASCQETQSTSGTSTTTEVNARSNAAETPTTSGVSEGQERTLPGGLRVIDIKVGNGPMAETGQRVAVHYTGWLTDGTKFDSSIDRGEPIAFVLGAPGIILGWGDGIKGMRVGGKRKLTIPPGLAYGPEGSPPVIPPDATLVFDVELMDVR